MEATVLRKNFLVYTLHLTPSANKFILVTFASGISKASRLDAIQKQKPCIDSSCQVDASFRQQ